MNTAIQELIKSWIVFPMVFIAASACFGGTVFRLSKFDLKSPLLLPTGFAALVVVGQFATVNWLIAPHTPLIVMIFTLLCALSFGREFIPWLKNNTKALALGLTVFYLHGLPILMSRTPTFAGWIKLDDGSIWLALTDQLLQAGHNTSMLAPSTHEAAAQIHLNPVGSIPYPSGSFVSLGVFSKWLFIDPAWLLQPYIAAGAMMLSVTLFALLQPIKVSNWIKVLAVVIAPTSALYLGYEMWGGIKELLLVPIIVLATALIPSILNRFNEPRCIIPFALACSAYVEIYSISGLVWLFMPALFLLVGITRALKRIPWSHIFLFFGTFGFCSIVTLYYIAQHPKDLARTASEAGSTSYVANLLGPLKFTQIFGVWLTGDFRYEPHFPVLNTALILLSCILFVLGCYFLIINGHSHIAVLAIWVTLISAVGLRGSPWISGKTLAMASPIVLVVALCAIGFIANRFSIEAWILAVILSTGVVASYSYTYHEVWLAPYKQLKELEVIGQNKSYASPALMIEFSSYGARHFLRKLDAESAGELRRHLIPLRTGEGLARGADADIDEFALSSVEYYQTLVLRKSPKSSRPPGNYDLKFSGAYYEVWQKNPDNKVPVEHYPFGSKDAQAGLPECSFLKSEIAPKLPGNTLLVSSATSSLTLPIVNVTSQTQGAGKKSVFESKFEVTNTSEFNLWVAGFAKGRIAVFIDGQRITTIPLPFSGWSAIVQIGDVKLTSGPHVLRAVMDSPWLTPGSGGISYPLGPFYLSDQTEKNSVTVVQPADLMTLCTKRVDWIELVPR